jgi:hypothetical protein
MIFTTEREREREQSIMSKCQSERICTLRDQTASAVVWQERKTFELSCKFSPAEEIKRSLQSIKKVINYDCQIKRMNV